MAVDSVMPSPLGPPACEKDTKALQFIEEKEMARNVESVQERVLGEILSRNAETKCLSRFGLGGATDRSSFKAKIPVVTYEDLQPEIQRIASGDRSNILCSHPISEFLTSLKRNFPLHINSLSLSLSTVAPQPRKMARRVGLFFLFFMVMVASAEARLLSFRWDVKHKLDSNKKLVIAINGKTPGPIVQAQRGDTIVVKVTNSLGKGNLAIHWDGLRQIGTPACGPVLAGGTCTYRFVADRVGAYSYESQYRMQKDAGLYGPIRVLP